jgi:hypothetical protein
MASKNGVGSDQPMDARPDGDWRIGHRLPSPGSG